VNVAEVDIGAIRGDLIVGPWTLPPGLFFSTFLEKKYVAATWSFDPRFCHTAQVFIFGNRDGIRPA